MQLPKLQGNFDQQDFFIYAACDAAYFDQFGTAFVNSIRANDNCGIHIHLFNPKTEHIDFCQRRGVTVTWEHVPKTLFVSATQRWHPPPTAEPELTRYTRTQNAMSKGGDLGLSDRMQKTYYACARFIRLAELWNQKTVLAVDIDAVVRKPIISPGTEYNFYLHHITGKKARYLAGGLWLNNSQASQQFLREYANQLISWFDKDYVYWGLDQDLLDPLVPQYNHGQLPMSYIDWNMHPDSAIWTAKGTRKDLAVFVNECRRYNV
jgi:hypothetical protein